MVITINLTETQAIDLIEELDHDDNGMGGGFTDLGRTVAQDIVFQLAEQVARESNIDINSIM